MCLKHLIWLSSMFQMHPLQNAFVPKHRANFQTWTWVLKNPNTQHLNLTFRERNSFSINKRLCTICRGLSNLAWRVVYITHIKALGWACPWVSTVTVGAGSVVPGPRVLSSRLFCHRFHCFSQTSFQFSPCRDCSY